ncbi:hypothetical protein BG004_001706 [Podila humilis]|nr:hypothetical protein BG004_001706 [Podila humilis]
MLSVDVLPTEIMVAIFIHDGLSDIARQVCQRWRQVALPIWLRRLCLLPSDPFKDLGLLPYLQSLPSPYRLAIRALDISARRDFDSGGNVFSSDVADDACVRNVLMIQSLLSHRIKDISLTDTGWSPESLTRIMQMANLTSQRIVHFQLSLFKPESFSHREMNQALVKICRAHAKFLKTLCFDLAHSFPLAQWNAIAHGAVDLEQFHLGLHRSTTETMVLADILRVVLPRWSGLTSLHLSQPRFLSPETLTCLYRLLPRPDLLRELHLIFEACQAQLYEEEFIAMIQAMPKLLILDAHLDWTNRMMEQVASRLPELKELSVTCCQSNSQFDCRGIGSIKSPLSWGENLEKLNMRTSARISRGFLDAVRMRSRRVKILVYGSMKWGGLVDEWE